MFNKEKREQYELAIRNTIYDLILSEETFAEERTALLSFKTDVEKGRDFDKQLMYLAENLRQLAVQSKLSKSVGEFYLTIATAGQRNKNAGLGSIGIWMN